MELSKDDVLKIVKIIEDSGYDEIRLEVGDFKLHAQKNASAALAATPLPGQQAPALAPAARRAETAPAAAAPSAPPAAQKPQQEPIPEGCVAVQAPMLGTFYRAPSPGEKPFVEVGDKVGPDDIVCLVEVMKLFNSVKAGVSGTIVRILVENATVVEYGQPLVLIEPDATDHA